MNYPAKKDPRAVWLLVLGLLVEIGVGVYFATLNVALGVASAKTGR